MKRSRACLYSLAGFLMLVFMSACTPAARMARAPEPVPALPPVPSLDGSLRIEVVYPRPEMLKPDADSSFIFGNVGTGRAKLSVNGLRVPVAPNGAFLAFVPVPEDGRYRLVAERGRRRSGHTFSYRTAPPPSRSVPAARPEVVPFLQPLVGTVTGGRDTLATGSETVHGAPAPGVDRRWFFPRGTRLAVTERRGGQFLVRLSDEAEAWVDTAGVRLGSAPPVPPEPVGAVSLRPLGRSVDVRIAASYAPFLIDPREQGVGITLYGRTAPVQAGDLLQDGFITRGSWQPAGREAARLELTLGEPLWGFKAFYDTTGALVVRLRRPPPIGPDAPLSGLRVLVDPGHPPGGALGPTGLTEADANLAVGLRLADRLRRRGAEVILTRTTADPLESGTSAAEELWARADLAVSADADLLVSVHNNAFPDGVNPFDHYGTETYYFHPFSARLAEALVQEIAGVTGLPNRGAQQRSLALVRPAWMPSVLTESLFMMFPQQEVALRTPSFIEQLAEAHVRGIEAFLRARAGAAVSGAR